MTVGGFSSRSITALCLLCPGDPHTFALLVFNFHGRRRVRSNPPRWCHRSRPAEWASMRSRRAISQCASLGTPVPKIRLCWWRWQLGQSLRVKKKLAQSHSVFPL